MKLRPYQDEAADFLYSNDRALVLAPVGAGKTALTLTAMQAMLDDGHARRFLVLAPLRVAQSVWLTEADKWAPKLSVVVATGSPAHRRTALHSKAQVVVTNYDNLQWLSEQELNFDAVVFDELTRLEPVRQAVQSALQSDRAHADPLGADRIVYVKRSGGRVRPMQDRGPDDVGPQQRRLPATILPLP